jgi:heme-degrading monooxygenase HmoA
MYITITSSQVTVEQRVEVEKFLGAFLPRLKAQPGVAAICHYARPEKDDETTTIVWRDQNSMTACRTGELVKEAIAFERKLGLKTTREAYPLIYRGTS